MSHRTLIAKHLEQQNERAAAYAPAGVQIRADVTTTVFVGPTGASSSGSGTTGVSITAIAGGLAAGVVRFPS